MEKRTPFAVSLLVILLAAFAAGHAPPAAAQDAPGTKGADLAATRIYYLDENTVVGVVRNVGDNDYAGERTATLTCRKMEEPDAGAGETVAAETVVSLAPGEEMAVRGVFPAVLGSTVVCILGVDPPDANPENDRRFEELDGLSELPRIGRNPGAKPKAR